MRYIVIIILVSVLGMFVYSACISYNVLSQVEKSAQNEIDSIASGQNEDNCMSLLDVIKESNSLIGANEITFFFTFIVAVLSIIFFYKIENVREMEKRIEKIEEDSKRNERKLEEKFAHATNFDFLFSLIKSNYDLAMMIENFTMTSTSHKSQVVLRQIGMLRFRLNKNLSLINERQDNRKTRLESLTKERHLMLVNYLDDTIEALHRSEGQNENVKHLLRSSIGETERIRDIVNGLRA